MARRARPRSPRARLRPWRRPGRRPAPCRAGRRRPCRPAPRRRACTRSTALKRAVRSSVTPTDQRALPSSPTRDEGDDAGADLLLGLVGQAVQVLGARRRRPTRAIELDAADVLRRRRRAALARAAAQRQRLLAPRPVRAPACGARRAALRRAPAVLERRLERRGGLARSSAWLGEIVRARLRRSAPRCGARRPRPRSRRRS